MAVDTTRVMYDQNGVVMYPGDIVAFDDLPDEEGTLVGFEDDEGTDELVLKDHPDCEDDEVLVASRHDLVFVRRETFGPFAVGDHVMSMGKHYSIVQFNADGETALCEVKKGTSRHNIYIDDLTLVDDEPVYAERVYRAGECVYYQGERCRIKEFRVGGLVVLEDVHGNMYSGVQTSDLAYDEDSQAWTPAQTSTPTTNKAAAMVTQATKQNLVCGMVVLPKEQPRSRKVHFRSGQLWVVSAYLKQTDSWKCHPVNGKTYRDRKGQEIQVFAKMDVENLQIIKVKGEM